jgi:hypothetical protein
MIFALLVQDALVYEISSLYADTLHCNRRWCDRLGSIGSLGFPSMHDSHVLTLRSR